jgi:hypothetical protein
MLYWRVGVCKGSVSTTSWRTGQPCSYPRVIPFRSPFLAGAHVLRPRRVVVTVASGSGSAQLVRSAVLPTERRRELDGASFTYNGSALGAASEQPRSVVSVAFGSVGFP